MTRNPPRRSERSRSSSHRYCYYVRGTDGKARLHIQYILISYRCADITELRARYLRERTRNADCARRVLPSGSAVTTAHGTTARVPVAREALRVA